MIFPGISYMNARCGITISEQSVTFVILRGRSELQVFIDDVEQDETKDICELFWSLVISIYLHISFLKKLNIFPFFRLQLNSDEIKN